jgi:ubiquinone/menaquinone biosynthesis C-methylase UbiE
MSWLSSEEMVDSSTAYNRFAEHYDGLLSENRINRYMRQQVLRQHLDAFQTGERLLEIGCGTGDEALELASKGCEVVAIDPSQEMLKIAKEKAKRESFGHRVTFLQGYGRDIGRLLNGFGDASFHGAYSSFSLSYERELNLVRDSLARLLRPGGWLMMALMNRLCATELVIATVALHPSLAGRRLSPFISHKVGTVSTEVFSRTVAEVKHTFAGFFDLQEVRALPAALPPPYMNRIVQRIPAVMDMLERVDPTAVRLPLVRCLGDHTLFKFRRGVRPFSMSSPAVSGPRE